MAALDPIERPLPLVGWPLVIALAAALVWLSSLVPTGLDDLEAYFRGELSAAQARPGRLVVFAGDSRAVLGLVEPEELARRVQQQLGGSEPVQFVPLAAGGLELDFYARLWPDVLRARPALVLVQLGLFAPLEDNYAPRLRQSIAAALKRLLRRGPPTRKGMLGAYCLAKDEAALRWHTEWLDTRMQRTEIPDSFARFADAAAAQQIAVRVVELPRSPRLQAALKGVPDAFVARTAAALARWPGLTPLTPPPIADDDFCDYGHLSEAGRLALAPWLARNIAEALTVDAR